MARGELLRRLFSSYSSHDEFSFRSTALEIIAEEQQKHNHSLAKDLMTVLESTSNLTKSTKDEMMFSAQPTIPLHADRSSPLVEIRKPVRDFSSLIVSAKVREQLDRVIEEYQKAELLRMHGLRPKNKILFYGPPGCGKTITAEILAAELRMPLLYTRFDSIISSYLGETASNIREVFDYARTGSWIVLLDEFDAIGKSRSDEFEHGELKRVVNSFLQILDSFDGKSIIIASTNHENLLDGALWRRFDEVISFQKPSSKEVLNLFKSKLKNFPTSQINYSLLAKKVLGLSHSEVEWICLDAIKSAILKNQDRVSMAILNESIKRQTTRSQSVTKNVVRAQKKK